MKTLLKFITCGSVDDGKSTLIGHMLYDAKLLFLDQARALEMDSKVRSGNGKIDYSLLLDGLMAEREQSITIDVAYRYFATKNRSFIVADTPGHEEYTRNMAVGASYADLAVILVDAAKGIVSQTRRHARICALMGIRHFVFAVNKMDLVGYDEQRFQRLETDIRGLMTMLGIYEIEVIPVSATEGDNLVVSSIHMPWYHGEALLHFLETVDIETAAEEGFVLPVQRVSRVGSTFRGFQGQIMCGNASVGDMLTVLPSGEQARIKSVFLAGREAPGAAAGQPVSIQLDREIDVSRGCMLVMGTEVKVTNAFTATLLWMDDKPLTQGQSFWIKLGTQSELATVLAIKYQEDIYSGGHLNAESIQKNEIAICNIITSGKIVCDKFSLHRDIGCFILIDRITNATSACGVIDRCLTQPDNLIWHNMDITRQIRSRQLGQKPKTIWLTGLSGSGKSTLANEMEKRLNIAGKHTMLLDGDNIRMGLNRDLSFSERDRAENLRRVAEVAKLMNDAGLIVLAAFISPFEADRCRAREIIGEEDFVEIYVNAPLEVCEKRDVNGLYKRARSGEISSFTGISSPYEKPQHSQIEIDTSRYSLEETLNIVMDLLQKYLD